MRRPDFLLRRRIQDSPKTEVTDPENRSLTSVIGDPPTTSPATEVTDLQNKVQTSTIGEPPTARRTRKLQTLKTNPQPPSSANHQQIAENGGYRPRKQVPNLRLRRLIIRGMDSSRFLRRIMAVSPAQPAKTSKLSQPNRLADPASPADPVTVQPIQPAQPARQCH